ncbi:MAG: type 1 glutamine amidotransferase [Roseivivax sp.]|nr:type 1 glutamine amidotransferase [Roseivivax sp.]
MKIGILQTGHPPTELAPTHGDYPSMFERLLGGRGFTFQTWSVVDGEFPAGPQDADGWLITGSRHGVYEDHPWIAPLEALVRDIIAAGKPLVGICFGHQVIAQALGGQVEKFDQGWCLGPQVYHFPDGDKRLLAYHQDQVITPPEGAEVVASSPGCRYAALLYPGKAYTVQPHPEFSPAYLQGLIDTRGRGVLDDTLLDAAEAALAVPPDNPEVAEQIARFLTERRIA